MTTTQLYDNLPPFTQAGYGGILPLTTVFTPKPECTAASAYSTSNWAGGTVALLLDNGASSSSCYPSSYSDYQYNTGVYYSPGVCPLSYEYVATSVQSDDLDQPITLAICCPSGVNYLLENNNGCNRAYSTPIPGLTFSRPSNATASASSSAGSTTLFANRIAIAWRASDLGFFIPTSAPVVALRAAGFAPSSTTSTKRTTPSRTSSPFFHPGNGLSSGAQAGIGVGAAVAGLILAAVLAWLIFRYKRKQAVERQYGQMKRESNAARESESQPEVFEAPHISRPFEADDQNFRAELDGGWVAPEAGGGTKSPV